MLEEVGMFHLRKTSDACAKCSSFKTHVLFIFIEQLQAQQHCEEDTENSHRPAVPTHARPCPPEGSTCYSGWTYTDTSASLEVLGLHQSPLAVVQRPWVWTNI